VRGWKGVCEGGAYAVLCGRGGVRVCQVGLGFVFDFEKAKGKEGLISR
jgi:hypothetical protein